MPASGVEVPQPSEPAGLPPFHAKSHAHTPHKYVSATHPQAHQHFLSRIQQILIDHTLQSSQRNSKVVKWMDPEALKKTLDLEVPQEPVSHESLLQSTKDILKYSVNVGHPYFVNQLFSGVDPYGLAGQWLTDTLNPSVYTYEVAPVFTLMEESVISKMVSIVGFPQGDGIFCPGGSIANGYAINCARYYKFPQVKTKGLHGLPRLVLFTSEDAHYSIKKMAAFEGLGSDNVTLVKTDSRGKMDPADLEACVQQTIAEGGLPFMVSATAGTTVLGAFDPLVELREICTKYEMWLHVDAAWGGGALLSKKHRHLLTGIEMADSVTWNPHKMLAAPQQCSTFLTRHPTILSECHSANAQYLFQKDKFYDTRYDTGDKHIQCGRRADVLKFWFMWKSKGSKGLEEHIDHIFEKATYFRDQIRDREGFKLVLDEPECTNITFWYIPPRLRNYQGDDLKQKLHKVAPLMKERMMREGTMMITYQPLKDLPNFFRLVLQNSVLTTSDMDHIITEIERLGKDLGEAS